MVAFGSNLLIAPRTWHKLYEINDRQSSTNGGSTLSSASANSGAPIPTADDDDLTGEFPFPVFVVVVAALFGDFSADADDGAAFPSLSQISILATELMRLDWLS